MTSRDKAVAFFVVAGLVVMSLKGKGTDRKWLDTTRAPTDAEWAAATPAQKKEWATAVAGKIMSLPPGFEFVFGGALLSKVGLSSFISWMAKNGYRL